MNALMLILRRSGLLRRPHLDTVGQFFEDFGLASLFSEETMVTPAFDVSETEKELIVKAEVPGMDKKDININLSDGLLTIKGEKSRKKGEERKKTFPLVFINPHKSNASLCNPPSWLEKMIKGLDTTFEILASSRTASHNNHHSRTTY